VSSTEGGREQARTGGRKTGIIIIGLILAFGIGLFAAYLVPSVHEVIRQQPVVAEPREYGPTTISMTTVSFREEGGDLIFSLDDLKRSQLIRFEYLGGKTPRTLMAYIAPDGRLVTSISLSEHCGSKEFEIRDNQIFCSNCPSHWDMMTMEAYACCAQYYPDPVPSRVVGNEVHIAKSVVENWAGRL
jgi:uncharacterized membrane protein